MLSWPAFLLVFKLIALVSAQKFRDDYLYAKEYNTYYRLHDVATDWYQARLICEAEGTKLLVPSTLGEVDNLKLLISNMKAHYTGIYTGIHNNFATGVYITIEGIPLAGTWMDLLWAEGSPDDINNGNQSCAIMTREGLFEDKPCHDVYPFVCKIFGNETEYNETCNTFDMEYQMHENGKCYKFHDEPSSWHDAYLICSAEQAKLVVINNQEEAGLLTSFLSAHLSNRLPDPNILYVGFSDLMFPFQYRTINGQTLDEAGYASWSPLKEDMTVGEEEHCGAISRTGFLKVTRCDMEAMFICEKRGNKTTLGEISDEVYEHAYNFTTKL